MATLPYVHITRDDELRDYCRELDSCRSIGFDTEFVSEHTFRPVLCLVQVAANGKLAVLDAMSIEDMTPFWEVLASPGRETLCHAARSEVEFCLAATGKMPSGLFDVQLAAGMAGCEYPAGYGTLIARLLKVSPEKHETRTDWRRRPLSERQIQYALEDVYYLEPLREALIARLEELGRLPWFREESANWEADVLHALSEERWRRVSGNAGLEPQSLAIVRALFQWREAEAQRRNQPARRVLRDDLIVELARRQTSDPKRIHAVRGLERGDLARRISELAACIEHALALPAAECPARQPREASPQLSVLGQFLFAALGSICRKAQLAPNLVGNPTDIRDLIAFRTARGKGRQPPKLAVGWRKEFVGRLFEDLLHGKTVIRVSDPLSDHPLEIESR